jgi:hypothetical protein
MDSNISRIEEICFEGNIDAKMIVKKCEKFNTHARYEKHANKIQRHIEFDVGNILWLNI